MYTLPGKGLPVPCLPVLIISMKRHLFSFIILVALATSLFLPQTAFAVCSCYDDQGVGTSEDATAECESACTAYGGGGTDTDGPSCACTSGTVSISCEDTCTDKGLSATDPTATGSGSTKSNSSAVVTPRLNVEIPGLNEDDFLITKSGNLLDINYLNVYVSAFYNYLLGASVVFAIIMIMIGGLQYTLAAGSGESAKAKTRIKNAVIGLVLLMSVYTILWIFNPQLLTLETPTLENIPKIDISNESTDLEDYDWEVAGTVGNGEGWNGVKMWDQKRFDDVEYGVCGTVKTSGCGVASFAMVATYFSGTEVSPEEVAGVFAAEGYRACPKDAQPDSDGGCPDCQGTYAAAFTSSSYMDNIGLVGQSVGLNKNAIKTALNDGGLVIMSYKTKGGGGHYVVITGVDSDEKVLVNNPYGGVKERRTWDQIESTIKSARAIYKK